MNEIMSIALAFVETATLGMIAMLWRSRVTCQEITKGNSCDDSKEIDWYFLHINFTESEE